MLITATWNVVLGSLALLASGDYMESEPSLQTDGEVQTVLPLRSAWAAFIPRGNVATRLVVSRIKNFDDDAGARSFLLSHALAVAGIMQGGALTCAITDLNTASDEDAPPAYTIAGAVIERGGFRQRVENNRFICQYTITGGQLATS